MTPTNETIRDRFAVPERGSAVVKGLEDAWKLLRSVLPELPPAVLTLLDVRSRSHIRGYFATSVWRKRRGSAHEIGINPRLIGQPTELVATMLHEAAHAVLHESGDSGGIGSTPYYHTALFRDKCVSFGLECEFWNTRYGWTLTHFPKSGVPARYRDVVKLLRSTLPAGTGGATANPRKGRPLPVPGHTRLTCACENAGRTVYVTKSVLKEGGVTCMICREEFLPRQ